MADGNNITRNTANVATTPTVTITGKKLPKVPTNILDSYKSYTYNWTLAGLDKTVPSNPTIQNFEASIRNFTVLKSGGKGNKGMAPSASTDATGQQMIDSFNKNSPGRFDMYIENVEIDSFLSYDEKHQTTLPSGFRFDVIEPYSLNGFLEALQVAAVGAGYVAYSNATYILKLQFFGYPDTLKSKDSTPPAPELIPGATRYFTIRFTLIDVELTERGTMYKCAAMPSNEMAYADTDNKLRQPIQGEGTTVGEILNDIMTKIQQQRASADAAGKQTVEGHDTYTIEFPKSLGGQTLSGTTAASNNAIANKDFATNLKDNKTFGFAEPGSNSVPNAYHVDGATPPGESSSDSVIRLNPSGTAVASFGAGTNITDIITSVIRDSNYTRDLLKSPKPDSAGEVDYFYLSVQITNQDKINDQTKLPYRNFKYIITPRKISITKLPGHTDENIDVTGLESRLSRIYDYLYMGNNSHLLSFKLTINVLYFEGVPNAMGNNDKVPAAVTGSQDNAVNPQAPTKDINSGKSSSIPQTGQRGDAKYTNGDSGVQAGLRQDDPYWVLAKAMHHAVINSRSGSLWVGEIEIIGDPFYLSANGMGNYYSPPDPNNPTISNSDGSANKEYGDIYIQINFKNPTDFQAVTTTGDGGMAIFIPEQVPFSGVYVPTILVSSFKNGVFKQRMGIRRPPQTDTTGVNPVKSGTEPEGFVNKPNPEAQLSQDANKTATQPATQTAQSYSETQRFLTQKANTPGLDPNARTIILDQVRANAEAYSKQLAQQAQSPVTKIVNK